MLWAQTLKERDVALGGGCRSVARLKLGRECECCVHARAVVT